MKQRFALLLYFFLFPTFSSSFLYLFLTQQTAFGSKRVFVLAGGRYYETVNKKDGEKTIKRQGKDRERLGPCFLEGKTNYSDKLRF